MKQCEPRNPACIDWFVELMEYSLVDQSTRSICRSLLSYLVFYMGFTLRYVMFISGLGIGSKHGDLFNLQLLIDLVTGRLGTENVSLML